jgi:hypothetical protein
MRILMGSPPVYTTKEKISLKTWLSKTNKPKVVVADQPQLPLTQRCLTVKCEPKMLNMWETANAKKKKKKLTFENVSVNTIIN